MPNDVDTRQILGTWYCSWENKTGKKGSRCTTQCDHCKSLVPRHYHPPWYPITDLNHNPTLQIDSSTKQTAYDIWCKSLAPGELLEKIHAHRDAISQAETAAEQVGMGEPEPGDVQGELPGDSQEKHQAAENEPEPA